MSNFPLQLKTYYLNELHFVVNDEYEIAPDNSIHIDLGDLLVSAQPARHQTDSLQWQFVLRLALQDPKERYPFTFSVEMVGYFSIDPDWPVEKQEELAHVNAPALLYSAARDLIMTITSRSYHTPFTLPTITFANRVKAAAKDRKQLAEEAAQKPEKRKIK